MKTYLFVGLMSLFAWSCSEAPALDAIVVENQQKQALVASHVKLMTYNIKNSFGCNDALCVDDSFYKKVEAIAAEVPDVVAIQEVGFRMRQADYEDQLTNMANYLSEMTGLNYQVHYFGYKDLAHQHPDRIDLWHESHGLIATGGDAIVTHHDLYGIAEDAPLKRDILSWAHDTELPNNAPAGPVRITLDFSGVGTKLIDFYGVHLQSGSDSLAKSFRLEQLHALERFVRKDRPAFLMGDLNARYSEVLSWPNWKTTQSQELDVYPSFDKDKQIDWILYRNFKSHNNVSVYESKDANNATYILSDHTPLVLEGEFTACDLFDPSNIDANFCSQRQSGEAQCRLCGLGEGTCHSNSECAGNLICGSAGLCAAPAATHTLPTKIVGYATPAPYAHSFEANIHSPTDAMYSMALRYKPTSGVHDSLWLTIDGVRVANQIRTDCVGSTWRTIVFKHIAISAGDHVLTLHSEKGKTNVKHMRFFHANNNPYELSPFALGNGTLEAEHFDVGGYSASTPGNQGNYPRYEDLDVYRDDMRSYVDFSPGDVANYTMQVDRFEKFDVTLRVKVDATSLVSLAYAGSAVVFDILSPSSEWQEVTTQGVYFPLGTDVFTLTSSMGMQVDGIYFKRSAYQSGSFRGEPWPHGEIIQAEFFDRYGFYDSDDKSLDEIAFRNDVMSDGSAPDIWHYEDQYVQPYYPPILNSYFIWNTKPNEYLEYTIEAGSTNDCIDLVYATPNNNSEICAELNGVSVGCVTPSSTGGWGALNLIFTTWGIAQIPNVDTSAGGVLKIIFKDGGINLDSLTVH